MKKSFSAHSGLHFIYGLLTIAIFACCNDSDADDAGTAGRNIKLQKLELNGAQYLSLTGNATRNTRTGSDSEVGLFKIDKEGNMTTVVLSCTEEEDGTVVRTRQDIRVVPSIIYPLGGAFTLMHDCSFIDEKGMPIYMKQYYEPQAFYFNILVRNSDGAIYYIPEVVSKEYVEYNENNLKQAVLDNKGNLYLLSNTYNLGMLTLQDGQLVMKQINPNNLGVSGEIIPLDNGTVLTTSYDRTCTCLYPNGGFEIITPDTDHYGMLISLTKLPSGIKAVTLNERLTGHVREFTVSLHDFHIGTTAGSTSISAPLTSIESGTDYSINLGDPNYVDWVSKISANHDWITGVYETSNSYIIGQCLIADKQTMNMRDFEWNESNRVIFPTSENTYKGLAWNVGSWGAEWYDIETLRYGSVSFNLPNDYQETSTESNIPSGSLIVKGVRYSDGKQVTYIVDIETGHFVCTETDAKRPITTLIPLN